MGQAKAPVRTPLVAKLQSWGYDALDLVPPFHLSTVVEKLDTAATAIVEKLARDLDCLNETSGNLRIELSNASEDLGKERQRAESLLKENEEFRKKLEQENETTMDKQQESSKQWKAHSMLKIRELESANEALRATLSRLSPCPSADCKSSESGQFFVSERLAQVGTVFRPQWKTTDLLLPREAITLVKEMEGEIQGLREKVSALTDKLDIVQGYLDARDMEIQQLHQSLKAIPGRGENRRACNGTTSCAEIEYLRKELRSLQEALDEEIKDDSTQTQLAALEMIRQKVDAACKLLRKGQYGTEQTLQEGTEQLERKLHKLEPVAVELECKKKGLPKSCQSAEALADEEKGQAEDLQLVILEHEATISKLQLELSEKHDQLIFIADEKVAGQEALTASQKECSQLAALIKELDGSLTQLTSGLTTRTMERDYAVAAEKRETEAHVAAVEDLTRKNFNLLSELEAAQAVVSTVQSELDRSKIQREEDRFQLAEARKQAESAEKDIEQLKTLITQLDMTREELVATRQNLLDFCFI